MPSTDSAQGVSVFGRRAVAGGPLCGGAQLIEGNNMVSEGQGGGGDSSLSFGRPELCRHVRAGKHRGYLLHEPPASRLHITVDREAHRVHGDPSDLRAKRTR